MKSRFSLRLAVTNLLAHKRLYIPYALSVASMVILFYNIQYFYTNKGLDGSGSMQNLKQMILMGGIVTGIFVVFFLLYANSFIMKQRTREFGLYGILGLEKRHVAKIMFTETAILFGTCLVSGLALGILVSKAMFLLLLKLLHMEVRFGFEITPKAILITVALFVLIFLITLAWNLLRMHLAQPVELLRAGNVGEREPRTKWVLAVLGFLCLGAGYAIAQLDANPVSAIGLFFLAVLLVVAGTYGLFTAGSIALLKALRRRKRYYYKTRHFVSVSGMIYRMKQNAVGLASICLLSTAVLVMLSTSVSLYVGLEGELRTRFPHNLAVETQETAPEKIQELDRRIDAHLQKAGVSPKNVTHYRYRYFLASHGDSGTFIGSKANYIQSRAGAWVDYAVFICIPLSDYNRQWNSNATLAANEVLLYANLQPYTQKSITFGELEFTVKSTIPALNQGEDPSARSTEAYYVIVPDAAATDQIAGALGEKVWNGAWAYSSAFDVDLAAQGQIKLARTIDSDVKELKISGRVESAEASRGDLQTTYGCLLFLGIFLGSLFMIATVLIIYYKQVSEGYQDRERFGIMQKVGMTKTEVRAAIRSQVLSVFYLPLLAAAVHILAAFKVITVLLGLLNLTNINLFIVCTLIVLGVFASFYALVYAATARTYYRIVG